MSAPELRGLIAECLALNPTVSGDMEKVRVWAAVVKRMKEAAAPSPAASEDAKGEADTEDMPCGDHIRPQAAPEGVAAPMASPASDSHEDAEAAFSAWWDWHIEDVRETDGVRWAKEHARRAFAAGRASAAPS